MTARTPPAFIPTLTRELQAGEVAALQTAPLLVDVPLLDEEVLPPEALHLRPTASHAAMATPLRPAAAPVTAAALNPVVSTTVSTANPAPLAAPIVAPVASTAASPDRRGIDDSQQQAEQMRARLLQRVDVIVQRRVREAAAAIALEHAQNLLQELRPALEKAIYESVNEALALELASRARR